MRLPMILLILVCWGCGGDEAAAPDAAPTPPPDTREAALALLDRADAAVYSPLQAGLSDATYIFRTSERPGVSVEVKWVKPDHAGGRLILDPGADAATAEWAATYGPSFVQQSADLADLLVGVTNRSQYEEDELSLLDPETVRVVARSERSRERGLRSAIISVGADGLPLSLDSETNTGRVLLSLSYRPREDGRWLVQEAESQVISGGTTDQRTLRFEYQTVGKYTMPRRVIIGGGDEEVTREFSEVRVDQGLTPAMVR